MYFGKRKIRSNAYLLIALVHTRTGKADSTSQKNVLLVTVICILLGLFVTSG
jgi:hypothetical protein